MKLNNKGFTLIEILAVVVIISIIFAIMIPNTNHLIKEQKENSLNNIRKSIESAAKIYLSDNKYDIEVLDKCENKINELKLKKESEISDSKISVTTLINLGYLKKMNSGMKNPYNNKALNEDETKVTVYYSCARKDLLVKSLTNESLVWINN